MTKPTAISLFLNDGETDSLREAGIEVSTIKAVAFRRSQLGRAIAEVPELSTPGAYVLFGTDPNDQLRAYVGESQDVAARLKTHLGNANKGQNYDHWIHTIALVSKDRLTKSHALYLESRLFELAKKAPAWQIQGGKTPGAEAGALSKHDKIIAEEILEQGILLFGTLGPDLFKLQEAQISADPAQAGTGSKAAPAPGPGQGVFRYHGQGFDGRMRVSSSGAFVVLKGSRLRANETNTLANSARRMRKDLMGKLIVEVPGEGLLLVEDYPFDSVSLAAAVVSGSTINGRTAWKTSDGKTYAATEATAALPEGQTGGQDGE